MDGKIIFGKELSIFNHSVKFPVLSQWSVCLNEIVPKNSVHDTMYQLSD